MKYHNMRGVVCKKVEGQRAQVVKMVERVRYARDGVEKVSWCEDVR